MSRVAIIGGGAWGSALASQLARHAHEVSVLVRRQELADALMGGRAPLLDGLAITPPQLASTDAGAVLAGAEAVLVVVPVAATLAALSLIIKHAPAHVPVALTAKGLDAASGALQPELALEYLGRGGVMLCGPSFADAVALQKPCCLVAAAERADDATAIAALFHATTIRVYTSADPIGVAVGGSVKNTIAIAAGIVGALGLGANARAALITRGLAEATRLALAVGGKRETLFGLAGIGDMLLSCTDSHSRNYAYGEALGRGAPPPSALAEGARTAASLAKRAEILGVEAPIIAAVARVVNAGADIESEIKNLLARPVDQEWTEF